MADYKELLRRAVEALPENNGAARRAVYEKARAALVGQLRAINPPLPARDITAHRLQLEDCIRQVEQEASEAVIAGMNGGQAELPPPPVYFEPAAKAQPASPRPQLAAPRSAAKPAAAATKPAAAAKPQPKGLPAGESIEDIIAAANAETTAPKAKPAAQRPTARPIPMRLASAPAETEPEADAEDAPEQGDIVPPRPSARPGGRPLPSIVARAEAAKGRSNTNIFGTPPSGGKPYDAPRRGPVIEPRREAPRLEPAARGSQALARSPLDEPAPYFDEPKISTAMSAVREVELEPQPADPQISIDRAIATLDREARGEHAPMDDGIDDDIDDIDDGDERPNGKARGLSAFLPGKRKSAREALGTLPPVQRKAKPARQARERTPLPRRGMPARESAMDTGFPRARRDYEGGGISAVTIFLVVFGVLLLGAGGAGYWAVSQGYLDIPSMFSPSAPEEAPAAAPATEASTTVTAEVPATPATGPGNTAAPAETPEAATELATEEDRLVPDPALTGTQPLALAAATPATEERLPTEGPQDAATAEAAVAAIDPVNVAGSQSLLLEASDDGTTGAVPFSGTVEWTKGTDEMGQPTLVGKANIPARNLGVDILIRRNADPSLPASHLMEVNFRVTDTFIGGSVAGLPGVLLKNEELVQGTPLVGASARVVGNSFLFALSASPEDLSNNTALLTSRKWMDLALIYATGKRAIITLEKDAEAESLFGEVFAAWGQTASAQ